MNFEKVILANILINPEAHQDVIIPMLKEEYFEEGITREAFKAVEYLYENSQEINHATVVKAAKDKNLKLSFSDVAEISTTTSIVDLMESTTMAELIKEDGLARKFRESSLDLIGKLDSGEINVQEALDAQEKTAETLSNGSTNVKFISAADLLPQVKKEMIEASMREGLSGLSTGFRGLDQATDGFRGGQLIIWAGRPAMGKSTSSLQMAINMCRQGKRVLVFSMEMKDVDINKKIVASVSGVDYSVVKSGRTTPDEYEAINNAYSIIGNELQGLMINVENELGVSAIRSTIRNEKKRAGVDCVIIDHISLVQGSNRYKGNRVLEIGEISRTLKKTALDLNIPIICLSQLNRGVEHRSVPTPQLSALRESGDIEQDADLVVFNYRPEYYGIETTEDGNSTEGLFELIIAKNREGQCHTIELRCDLAKSQVMDAPTAADEYF